MIKDVKFKDDVSVNFGFDEKDGQYFPVIEYKFENEAMYFYGNCPFKEGITVENIIKIIKQISYDFKVVLNTPDIYTENNVVNISERRKNASVGNEPIDD
jgi:hypothetical protein